MKSIDLVTYYFVFLLERRRFKKLFDSVEIGLIKFCLLDLFHTVLESDLLVFSGANTQSFYNKVMIKVEASQFPGHHLLIITPISSFWKLYRNNTQSAELKIAFNSQKVILIQFNKQGKSIKIEFIFLTF